LRSYATHRSGAIKIENATGLTLEANEFTWIGGNGVRGGGGVYVGGGGVRIFVSWHRATRARVTNAHIDTLTPAKLIYLTARSHSSTDPPILIHYMQTL
jgi:hypothetical protein